MGTKSLREWQFRHWKENIWGLTVDAAFDVLEELEPVRYNNKVDGEED